MATARPDTWMPIYWGDYAKDTGHLSAAHHGAYLMLIKHYWVTGKPLPIDDAQLWRIACADSLTHWRKLKPVVLAFFEVRDGALHHGRVEKELTAAGQHAERRAETARRASRARWGGNARSNPTGNAPSILDASEDSLTQGADERKTSPANNSSGSSQPTEIIEKADAPRMPDAMLGQSPPPSPSQSTVTATESVSGSERASNAADWEPLAEPTDDLAIPAFLRKSPPTRAQPIDPEWLPSEETVASLKKARPDLSDQRIVERTVEFRNWCAESNRHTHNPDATWFNFMVKTHAERSRTGGDRKSNLTDSLEALAEFGRTGTG
jgi:uncharacterized protein YdaU (DUF1376 family)